MPQDVGFTGTCMRSDQQKYIPSELKFAKLVVLCKNYLCKHEQEVEFNLYFRSLNRWLYLI